MTKLGTQFIDKAVPAGTDENLYQLPTGQRVKHTFTQLVNYLQGALNFASNSQEYRLPFEENLTQPAYDTFKGGWASGTEELQGVSNVSYRTRLVGSTTWVSRATFADVQSYAVGLNASDDFVLEATATVSEDIVSFIKIIVNF